MGARIAALFASVGVPVYLLDITEELARAAIARTQAGDLVTAGSFADGIPLLRGYDWVLEAVVEELEAKRELWRRVSPCISPDAIASTNTSGLSIAAIANGMAPEFQRQFLGVHFFNPPANLHLVEIVRSPQTRPDIAAAAIRFVSERLAKGVIEARDTPNFIANRIGAFFSASAQSLAIEGNWTIEEVDHMTGPLIGMPRTGTYRLMDVIGLDVWARVLESLELPLQPYYREMLCRGWLGVKTGGGFYRKSPANRIEALDLQTLQYRPAAIAPLQSDSLPPLPKRLHSLLRDPDPTAAFLNPLLSRLIAYAHEVAPLIANSPSDIDLAMRWGYGWSLGPFEIEAAIR